MTWAEKQKQIVAMFVAGASLEDVLIAGLTNRWSRADVERVVAGKGWVLTETGMLPFNVRRKETNQRKREPKTPKPRPVLAPRRQVAERPYTVAEIAEALHVSPMSVYRLIHLGEIGHIRVGRSIRVPIAAYEQYLASAVTEAS
jgi:excisionase family DNA binding protein